MHSFDEKEKTEENFIDDKIRVMDVVDFLKLKFPDQEIDIKTSKNNDTIISEILLPETANNNTILNNILLNKPIKITYEKDIKLNIS